jgi:predicted CopG family antitoxin
MKNKMKPLVISISDELKEDLLLMMQKEGESSYASMIRKLIVEHRDKNTNDLVTNEMIYDKMQDLGIKIDLLGEKIGI